MSDILQKRAVMQGGGPTSPRGTGRYHFGYIQNEESMPSDSSGVQKSDDSFHSARSFEVSAADRGSRKLMSEEEVSNLVHNALRRARQATGGVPVNEHSQMSPRHDIPSPRGLSDAPSSSTYLSSGKLHQFDRDVASPRLTSTTARDDKNDIRSTNTYIRDGSSAVDRRDHYDIMASDIPTDMSNLSSEEPVDDTNAHVSHRNHRTEPYFSRRRSAESTPSRTENSSDAIIRRVEEEIANARKAAQEANRRLAGVNHNLERTGLGGITTRTTGAKSYSRDFVAITRLAAAKEATMLHEHVDEDKPMLAPTTIPAERRILNEVIVAPDDRDDGSYDEQFVHQNQRDIPTFQSFDIKHQQSLEAPDSSEKAEALLDEVLGEPVEGVDVIHKIEPYVKEISEDIESNERHNIGGSRLRYEPSSHGNMVMRLLANSEDASASSEPREVLVFDKSLMIEEVIDLTNIGSTGSCTNDNEDLNATPSAQHSCDSSDTEPLEYQIPPEIIAPRQTEPNIEPNGQLDNIMPHDFTTVDSPSMNDSLEEGMGISPEVVEDLSNEIIEGSQIVEEEVESQKQETLDNAESGDVMFPEANDLSLEEANQANMVGKITYDHQEPAVVPPVKITVENEEIDCGADNLRPIGMEAERNDSDLVDDTAANGRASPSDFNVKSASLENTSFHEEEEDEDPPTSDNDTDEESKPPTVVQYGEVLDRDAAFEITLHCEKGQVGYQMPEGVEVCSKEGNVLHHVETHEEFHDDEGSNNQVAPEEQLSPSNTPEEEDLEMVSSSSMDNSREVSKSEDASSTVADEEDKLPANSVSTTPTVSHDITDQVESDPSEIEQPSVEEPHELNSTPLLHDNSTNHSIKNDGVADVAEAVSPQFHSVSNIDDKGVEDSEQNDAASAVTDVSQTDVVPHATPAQVAEEHETEQKLSNRSTKLRFKQRYPVPPLSMKAQLPEELVKKHHVAHSTSVPFLSKPKPDLRQLLQAAIGKSLHRRSNACGALKVLTTQKKNKLTLVRTAGFLDSLVFALSAEIPREDRDAARDARTRAAMAISNVSEPKDNREIVFCHPGLVAALIKTVADDRGEGRMIACGALAMLAKSPSNRQPMTGARGLIDALVTLVPGCQFEPDLDEVHTNPYSSEEDSDHDSSYRRSYSTGTESSFSIDNSSSGSNDEYDAGMPFPRVKSMRQETQEKREETAKRSQTNACATLSHLSKQCGAASIMCEHRELLVALVQASQISDDPLHTKYLEILCNLSRFPANNGIMAKFHGLVDGLVVTAGSEDVLDRVWSLRVLQNLSSHVAGKTVLANRSVLELLSYSAMRETLDEQKAATATLYNLSTEPGAVVPLTNTKNVVATLVHVAHNPDSSSEVRVMACDALATLGLWLQTLAGAGSLPEEVDPNTTLPSFATSGWNRWD